MGEAGAGMTFTQDHVANPRYHACYYRASCSWCLVRYMITVVRIAVRRRLKARASQK